MPKKSRQKKGDNLDIKCRKCQKTKGSNYFFSAVDTLLDTNGYFSICKACCEEVYKAQFASEKDFSKAMLKTCRILNLAFNESAVASALTRIEASIRKQRETKTPVGVYKKALAGVKNVNDPTLVLTFREPKSSGEMFEFDGDIPPEILQRWGRGKTWEDYIWLEETLSKWKQTHKSDTMAEETLLIQIVWKQWDIAQAREKDGGETATLVKELQALMKTAAVDPGKANAASSGKSVDTWGEFIKIIEQTTPAEYYKDKELYKDFDNIRQYFKDYILRPIKNFITGSRDFNVSLSSDGDIESVDIPDDEDFGE